MEAKYVRIPVSDSFVLVKVEPIQFSNDTKARIPESGYEDLGVKERIEEIRQAVVEDVDKSLKESLKMIDSIAHSFWQTIGDIEEAVRPSEVSVEFGIEIDVKGNVAIAELGAGGNFKVSLAWKIDLK